MEPQSLMSGTGGWDSGAQGGSGAICGERGGGDKGVGMSTKACANIHCCCTFAVPCCAKPPN